MIKVPKLPPLTTALRFPVGSLLDRINTVVPRYLARDHRDDIIGEMALAVYEGSKKCILSAAFRSSCKLDTGAIMTNTKRFLSMCRYLTVRVSEAST